MRKNEQLGTKFFLNNCGTTGSTFHEFIIDMPNLVVEKSSFLYERLPKLPNQTYKKRFLCTGSVMEKNLDGDPLKTYADQQHC